MSRTRPPRLALAATLLLSGAALAATPGGTPPKKAPQAAASSVSAAEKTKVSHSIGLLLAKPLRDKVKRGQLLMPEVARGIKDALGGKEQTDEQQLAIQAFVRSGSGDKKMVSYSMGVAMGQPLRVAFLSTDTLSVPDIINGIGAALDGVDSTSDTEQQAFEYMNRNKQALADQNHAKAQAFLAGNRSQPGVVTTASGLQYKILDPGKGTPPGPTDTVSVLYTGKLLDGTEFDGTDRRDNEPTSFQVNGVIKGWQEALLMMKPGAKWQLFIPPALAYDVESPDHVPPGSLLLFTVQLLKVGAAGK
jgi:FKBP-type peptidyl-prolyl cis-trans isomerase